MLRTSVKILIMALVLGHNSQAHEAGKVEELGGGKMEKLEPMDKAAAYEDHYHIHDPHMHEWHYSPLKGMLDSFIRYSELQHPVYHEIEHKYEHEADDDNELSPHYHYDEHSSLYPAKNPNQDKGYSGHHSKSGDRKYRFYKQRKHHGGGGKQMGGHQKQRGKQHHYSPMWIKGLMSHFPSGHFIDDCPDDDDDHDDDHDEHQHEDHGEKYHSDHWNQDHKSQMGGDEGCEPQAAPKQKLKIVIEQHPVTEAPVKRVIHILPTTRAPVKEHHTVVHHIVQTTMAPKKIIYVEEQAPIKGGQQHEIVVHQQQKEQPKAEVKGQVIIEQQQQQIEQFPTKGEVIHVPQQQIEQHGGGKGDTQQQQQQQQEQRPRGPHGFFGRQPVDENGFGLESSSQLEASASQRARDSFLQAADVARQLASRPQTSWRQSPASGATSNSNPDSSNLNETLVQNLNSRFAAMASGAGSGGRREVFSASDLSGSSDELPVAGNSTSRGLDKAESREQQLVKSAKYLGVGQVTRHEGSSRTQVRLSCQFADPQARNTTIWNVEWARFEGDYDFQQRDPPFECRQSTCHLQPIRTDTLTTIHPRPFIQNFIDSQAPSYSVTLHEIEDKHIGVYRCSALRDSGNGKTELVYRVIPLNDF